MGLKETNGFKYMACGSKKPHDPCIYYMGLPQEFQETEKALEDFPCTVMYVVISDWDNQLSPWPAKGLYHGDADFQGDAPDFLDTLVNDLIPAIEEEEGITPAKRAIAGYSMGGLFSVYAFSKSDMFEYVASMSGSFWFEGWVDYVTSLHLDKSGCGAFVSLGDRERKAREKILHSVQENTDITIRTLKSWGVKVQHHLVPGGHFDNIFERVDEGLTALAIMMR